MVELLDKSYFSSLDIEARFRALAQEFCAQCAREGINLIPYTESSWQKFRQLDPEAQEKKLRNFESYYRICSESILSGIGLRGGIALLKRLFETSGWRAPDGIYDSLSDDDVIEVYSSDFTQIFRNLRFMEICSYPLVDLYIYEWSELYRRPHTVTERLIYSATRVLTQYPPSVFHCDVPNHLLEEVFSPERRKFFIQQKTISPVIDERDTIVGVISAIEATLVGNGLIGDALSTNVRPLSR